MEKKTLINLEKIYGTGYNEIKPTLTFQKGSDATNFIKDAQANDGKGVNVTLNGGS